MQRSRIALGALALLVTAISFQQLSAQTGAPAISLQTTRDQASYAIGMSIARQIQRDGLPVNVDALAQGIKDALNKTQPRLTQEQCQAAVMAFGREVEMKNQERQQVEGAKNQRDGQAFLAANKAKDGVVALPSGLQYKIVKTGNGPSPTANDKVTVHYHGTLIDGTVFDSSVQRGEPASFPVGGVIRGWTEALQLMKVGDKWQLYIPAELAYGPRGAGGDIGPNSVLIFDVELLKIGD